MPDTTGEKTVPPAAVRKGPRGQVTVFGLWCKGCGICVELCPTGVLELNGDDHPYPAHPDKCTACHFCDTHCPDLAIEVRLV